MTTRVGMLDAQRFSIKAGADAVYDQIAKPGEFLKEGESVTFDHETLSSMVRNFSKQRNPLPADVEHQLCYVPMNGQPAPLAARYDSLVLVEGGKVTAYHSQTGASAPDVAGWDDGLFGRRSEVTPFGRDLLDNKGYGFISPTFMTDGLDAQGNEQGYTLLSASWVNLPFLDGMQPVTFARLGAPSATPGAHAMAAYFSPGERVEVKQSGDRGTVVEMKPNRSGVNVVWVRFEDGETRDVIPDNLKKMSAAPTRAGNQSPTGAARPITMGASAMNEEKMAARFGFEPNDSAEQKLAKCMAALADEEVKAMGELEIVHKDDDDEKEEVAAMAADLGVEPGPKVMSRIRAAMAATRAPVTAMAALQGEVKALSAKLAERDKADADAKLHAFATDAINAGQWDPEKREALITFARADMKAAQSSLLPAGTYTALARITAGLDSRGNASGSAPDANGVQRFGVKLSDAAKKFARDNKVSFEKALAEVAKDPALASDYIAR